MIRNILLFCLLLSVLVYLRSHFALLGMANNSFLESYSWTSYITLFLQILVAFAGLMVIFYVIRYILRTPDFDKNIYEQSVRESIHIMCAGIVVAIVIVIIFREQITNKTIEVTNSASLEELSNKLKGISDWQRYLRNNWFVFALGSASFFGYNLHKNYSLPILKIILVSVLLAMTLILPILL